MEITAENQNHQTSLKFQFNGKASEYFSIWIVNVGLTIITFGIYSAWAKVRNNQYFYGNTTLGGASFRYLADPIKILKGRIIAFLALGAYYGSSLATPLVAGIIFFMLMVLFPAFMVMSMSFRMKYTSWRNIRFNFDKDFKKAYLLLALPMIVVGAYLFLAMMIKSGDKLPEFKDSKSFLALFLIFPLLIFLFFPLWDFLINRFQIVHSKFGRTAFLFSAKSYQYYFIYIMAFVVFFIYIMAVIILFVLLNIALGGSNSDKTFTSTPYYMVLIFIGIIPAYLFLFAYIHAKRTNLILNHVHIGEHRLKSELKAFYILYLYFTNTLAIAFTLGLLTPWAKIRTARYRAKCTTLFVQGDLDSFINGEVQSQTALGEEMSEIFDLDIGI